jgi:hypothetical protein
VLSRLHTLRNQLMHGGATFNSSVNHRQSKRHHKFIKRITSCPSKLFSLPGASSGFGPQTAKALAQAGYTVYASMREIATRNAPQVAALADPSAVAREIVRVVKMPFGKRPFRVHVDPSQDGAEVVNAVADRMRREMYRNIGLIDLLSPRSNS